VTRKKIKVVEKINRKDDLDPNNDKFVVQTMSFMDWAYERRRAIGLFLAVALVSALAGILIDHLLEGSRSADSAVLSEGLETWLAPVARSGEGMPPESDRLVFETAKARATATLSKFRASAAQTGASMELVSELGQATAYLELGEYDNAQAAFERFLKNNDSSVKWLRPSAVEGLSYTLEALGKSDEAIQLFESLMESDTGAAADMAKYHIARLAMKKNDTERASALLREVIESASTKGQISRLDYLVVQSRERLLEIDPNAEVPDVSAGGLGGLEGIDPALLRKLLNAQGAGGPS
jgi:tetratricopeptide (TPR) repeat protein